jgi:O-acetylhomoserine/O-acetylserine sulfhydrylase-like pyridoxal-dependent enzyme
MHNDLRPGDLLDAAVAADMIRVAVGVDDVSSPPGSMTAAFLVFSQETI